jgi:hypothetical protein
VCRHMFSYKLTQTILLECKNIRFNKDRLEKYNVKDSEFSFVDPDTFVSRKIIPRGRPNELIYVVVTL